MAYNPFSVAKYYFSYLAVLYLTYPLRISGVLSLSSIVFFVASFDAADVMPNFL